MAQSTKTSCCTSLSRKSYDTHKPLFYDCDTNQWIKKNCLTTEVHQRELTSTEQAIEECDFDFNTKEHEAGGVSQADSPPPLVDFEDDPHLSLDFEPDTGLMTPEAEGK